MPRTYKKVLMEPQLVDKSKVTEYLRSKLKFKPIVVTRGMIERWIKDIGEM